MLAKALMEWCVLQTCQIFPNVLRQLRSTSIGVTGACGQQAHLEFASEGGEVAWG